MAKKKINVSKVKAFLLKVRDSALVLAPIIKEVIAIWRKK